MSAPAWPERLADELGVPRWRAQLDSSPRSRVWLAELGDTPVVSKEVIGDDSAFDREVSALRLAARAEPPVVPALLGAADQVLVLEFLSGTAVPADWPVQYAAGLRRLHRTTSVADAAALPRWSPPTERDVDAFLGFARHVGVPVTAVAESEVDILIDRLTPHDFALLHGDPCPPNDIYTESGVRFVDLEQASLGDGATDLAYLRVGMPTCWCALDLDPALVAEAERTYGGDTDVADACAGWLLRGDALVQKSQRRSADHIGRLSVADWTWGTASARQRFVHRLGVVAAERDRLGAFADLARALRSALLTAWPDVGPLLTTRPDTWP